MEIFQLHLLVLNLIHNTVDVNQAFQVQTNICSTLNRLAGSLSRWILPVLNNFNVDLIRLAEKVIVSNKMTNFINFY